LPGAKMTLSRLLANQIALIFWLRQHSKVTGSLVRRR